MQDIVQLCLDPNIHLPVYSLQQDWNECLLWTLGKLVDVSSLLLEASAHWADRSCRNETTICIYTPGSYDAVVIDEVQSHQAGDAYDYLAMTVAWTTVLYVECLSAGRDVQECVRNADNACAQDTRRWTWRRPITWHRRWWIFTGCQ